jgi:hypothetical protein
MVKTFYISALSALALCSFAAVAQDIPSQEQIEAISECMSKADISKPKLEGGKPAEFNEEQKEAIDNCFKELGLEVPEIGLEK